MNNPNSFNNSRFGDQTNNPPNRSNAGDQFASNRKPRRRKKWKANQPKEQEQDNESFIKDDIEGYKPFKSFDHEIKQGFSADGKNVTLFLGQLCNTFMRLIMHLIMPTLSLSPSIPDLMVKVKGRNPITLEFLEKLVGI